MIKEIYIKSDCDDGMLIEGEFLNSSNSSIKSNNHKVEIIMNDDGIIMIPPGNYELLSIKTDCGDFEIKLPNCYFERVVLKSDSGDMRVTTNYNDIDLKTTCGECQATNLDNKNNIAQQNNTVMKTKKVSKTFAKPQGNKRDRYF